MDQLPGPTFMDVVIEKLPYPWPPVVREKTGVPRVLWSRNGS
jgi:hypothetical protein